MKQWVNHLKIIFLVLGTVLIGILLYRCAPDETGGDPVLLYKPPFLASQSASIDSLVANMSIDDLIGHLFVVRSTVKDTTDEKLLKRLIQEGKIGGVLLEGMPVKDYLNLLEDLRDIADYPLFIASDQQYLINNQFNDKPILPSPISYYALPEDSLKIKLRLRFAKQIFAAGINLFIGPEFDEGLPLGRIASNRFNREESKIAPNGEIIHPLRENRVLSLAQRFSASRLFTFGDTSQVSELLFPYQKMIDQGVSGFMLDTSVIKIDHPEPFFARTFFTQKLDFKGVLGVDISANIDLIDEAFAAGADLFITDQNVQQGYDYIKFQILSQRIEIENIQEKVVRILTAKRWMHNADRSPPGEAYAKVKAIGEEPDSNLVNHLNARNWQYVRRKIFENSLIIANNEEGMIPISNIYKRKFHIIQYSNGQPFSEFVNSFGNYATQIETGLYRVSGPLQPFRTGRLEDVYVVILDDIPLAREDLAEFVPFLSDLARRSEVILINFGSYYNLRLFGPGLTIIQINERHQMTESLAAQLLFGSATAQGVLPFDANEVFRAQQGTEVENFRLKFATADEVGIQPQKLYSIDAVALSAIDAGAMPGCQILLAKEGKIVYSKGLGYHTYDKYRPVKIGDLYDIASITKAAATTLAVMKLYEKKQLKLQTRLKDVLTLEDNSTIRNIRIRQLLSHSSGLQSNMPIVRFVYLQDSTRRGPYFYKESSAIAPIPVAEKMFFNKSYLDTIWQEVQFLELDRKKFRYSDVNFVLLQKVIEEITQMPMDSFLQEEYYGPMGLQNTLFNPWTQFDTSKVVPTEIDDKWRLQTVRGYVHDETAALMGGIAGNAGLFSNAEELAIIFQMLLNGGTYGGTQYLDPKTIELFTGSGHGNHRGLGFDKPYSGSPAVSRDASAFTFGHTGFTGTCVWVDPKFDLLYIFLSNRIHPSRASSELVKLRVRERIQQLIYDALNSYQPDTSIPDLPFSLN